ncbi:MAG: hypothetical protein R3E66_22725 [bacterium]
MMRWFLLTVLLAPTMVWAQDKPADTPQAWVVAEMFAGGRYTATDGDDFNAFDLDRMEVGLGLRKTNLGGVFVNVETLRSATPESLFGVDGNSLVLRAKHAFAFGDPELGPGRLRVALGLIADPWIVTLEDGYRLRSVRALASETSGFFDTSDLGVSLGYDLWDGFGELTVAWTNGEGRNDIEQNTGKNATVVASVRPWAPEIWGQTATLGLHAVWRDGSVGRGFAPNHRLGGAVTLTHPSFGFGAEFVQATGTQDADVDARLVSCWGDFDVLSHWLGVFAGFDFHTLNVDASDTSVTTLQGGVYSDVIARAPMTSWRHDIASQPGLSRLRVALHGRSATYQAAAGALVGSPNLSNSYQILLTVEAAGLVF